MAVTGEVDWRTTSGSLGLFKSQIYDWKGYREGGIYLSGHAFGHLLESEDGICDGDFGWTIRVPRNFANGSLNISRIPNDLDKF
jgi:hypothetical protein